MGLFNIFGLTHRSSLSSRKKRTSWPSLNENLQRSGFNLNQRKVLKKLLINKGKTDRQIMQILKNLIEKNKKLFRASDVNKMYIALNPPLSESQKKANVRSVTESDRYIRNKKIIESRVSIPGGPKPIKMIVKPR